MQAIESDIYLDYNYSATRAQDVTRRPEIFLVRNIIDLWTNLMRLLNLSAPIHSKLEIKHFG